MSGMIAGHLALIIAAVFRRAAIYVNVVEQPTSATGRPRLACAVATELQPGVAMRAPLAILAGILRAMAFFASYDWRWLLGAPIIVSNWPCALLVIVPTNNRLMATAPEAAGPEARRSVGHWGALHGGRAALCAATALTFVCALD
jgi:hypothetical protein